jgi:hypothetical protein
LQCSAWAAWHLKELMLGLRRSKVHESYHVMLSGWPFLPNTIFYMRLADFSALIPHKLHE